MPFLLQDAFSGASDITDVSFITMQPTSSLSTLADNFTLVALQSDQLPAAPAPEHHNSYGGPAVLMAIGLIIAAKPYITGKKRAKQAEHTIAVKTAPQP